MRRSGGLVYLPLPLAHAGVLARDRQRLRRCLDARCRADRDPRVDRSEHGELYWEIDVKSDEMGPDTHLRRRIEVVPGAVPEEEDIFAGGFGDDEG